MVTRRQLSEFGFSAHAIDHRIGSGRLHPVYRGVYAVGRPELTRYGQWMAAVLSCGSGALLSHHSAAELWGVRRARAGPIEVSVPARRRPRPPDIVVHRRAVPDPTRRHGIPVTGIVSTIVAIAPGLTRDGLEAAVNEADKLELITPDALREAVGRRRCEVGAPIVRDVLDRRTFTLTASALERLLLPIARRAGLPKPLTGVVVNGFEVDFHFPGLRLVVECDGLRYHRTPAQQARDRLRDQAHVAAGLTPLRFTHAQVKFQPGYVEATLKTVARRLAADPHCYPHRDSLPR